MAVQFSFGRRAKLLILAVILLVVVGVLFFVARSLFRQPPTPNEIRLQHLDYMVRLLEAYSGKFGAYPQPSVRRETPDGVSHVWGYETGKSSLASCTAAFDSNTVPDLTKSRCGGDIYDVQGNVIGWKGTLSPESGMNSVDLAGKGIGRVSNPLSDLAASIPIDPAYSLQPALFASGFGEYVYAVRMPEDKATTKGGAQYQLALTLQDPETGMLTTHVRGNYFVPSEDRDLYPSSLIGPGLVMDAYGNPVQGQSQALQVLNDQQREGFPHPSLGEGEETLLRLSLKRRVQRLSIAIDDRMRIADSMTSSASVEILRASLHSLHADVSALLAVFDSDSDLSNISEVEVDMREQASRLEEMMHTFLTAKGEEVKSVLKLEVEDRNRALSLLKTAFQFAVKSEDSVLEARDEILKYLDGEGIEEQSRNRAGRKLQSVLDNAPKLSTLFASANLSFPVPFFTVAVQEDVLTLGVQEGADPKSSQKKEQLNTQAVVSIMTIASELHIHLTELAHIVSDIQSRIANNAVTAKEVDEALRKLSQALNEENIRLQTLFDSLDSSEELSALLEIVSTVSDADLPRALLEVAQYVKLRGNFAPLLFSPALLDAVILEQSPGVPDYDLFENRLEAEYKGIPYPLP